MINTSAEYKQLFEDGAIQEYKMIIDDIEYSDEVIYGSVEINQKLFDKPTFTVGSFPISELKTKLKLPSNDISINANIEFWYRYTNGVEHSEWIKKFSGKIVDRTILDDNTTSIMAKDRAYNYDEFLDFMDMPQYPANAREVAIKCANHLGLTLDNPNDIINQHVVEFPNVLTVVQVLQNIAGLSGGNFIITEDDKLRLATTKRRNMIKDDFSDFTPYAGATVTRNKTFPIEVFKGGRNLIKNSGVTKQFTEQVPKPQINSDFDLEQVLTLKCYFKIQLGDLI